MEPGAASRVRQLQPPGMQGRPGERTQRPSARGVAHRFPPLLSVGRIADDRPTAMSQVDADLVRSARFDPDLQKGDAPGSRDRSIVGDGRPAASHHGHLLASHWMAGDRRLDPTRSRLRTTPGHGEIALADAAGRELAGQDAVCLGGARDHQDTARPDVEPMDDPGSAWAADAADLRKAFEEMMGQGSSASPRAGVNGQAGRLVDRHQPGILVQQAQVAGLGIDAGARGRGRGPADLGAGAQELRGAGCPRADLDPTLVDPSLNLVARNLEGACQETVEPFALRVVGDVEAPALDRGRTGRRRRGVQVSRRGLGQVATSTPPGVDGRVGERKESRTSSTRPIEIAMSATLKSGQW